MAAVINLICEVDHGAREGHEYVPVVAVYEGEWAYCRGGGSTRHTWTPITPPLSIDDLRLTPYGRFVFPDDVDSEPVSPADGLFVSNLAAGVAT